MRTEIQPANQIGVSLELVLSGIGLIGAAATTEFQIQRISDSKWWDDSATDWTVGVPLSQQLNEIDATNFQGLYGYTIPSGSIDIVLGNEGYRFVVRETTHSVREHGYITVGPVLGGIWKELIADRFSAADDDFANLAFRMAALRQTNMRFVPSAWDTTTKQPTAGEVLVYETKTDLQTDIGPAYLNAIGRYTVDAVFDGLGQLTRYTSVKDS
jgi:hypothetical protein